MSLAHTRKVVFLTGTRADFGKMKPLIEALNKEKQFNVHIFATGMHISKRFGETVNEILKSGFPNVTKFSNGAHKGDAALSLANTVLGFKDYIEKLKPDLIIIHGDRIEALAGALVGALTNMRVGHIEGGEISGTVDEHIRHAVSKLAHLHFVANKHAKRRLIQLGENASAIFVIGSPDLDIMCAPDALSIGDVKAYYGVPFEEYGIGVFHPVTTEASELRAHAENFVRALIRSGRNYVMIYPNNDLGGDIILKTYRKKLRGNPHFRLLPSVRFEYFLTLIRHAHCMVGNSSAGVRETPLYGVPSIDIGSRQHNRLEGKKVPSITHVEYGTDDIVQALTKAFRSKRRFKPKTHFGRGDSTSRFLKLLKGKSIWQVHIQKKFVDAF